MSSQISDPRELFLHELGDVLYAERTLVKTLAELRRRRSTPVSAAAPTPKRSTGLASRSRSRLSPRPDAPQYLCGFRFA